MGNYFFRPYFFSLASIIKPPHYFGKESFGIGSIPDSLTGKCTLEKQTDGPGSFGIAPHLER
jgi:hypothetical protein